MGAGLFGLQIQKDCVFFLLTRYTNFRRIRTLVV